MSSAVNHYNASSSSHSTSVMGNAHLRKQSSSSSSTPSAAVSPVVHIGASAHTNANPHSLSSPSDYNILRTIRQSIYGKVRLATLRARPDVLVALKISSLAHVRNRTTLEDPEQETRIMRLLSANGGHPHVLKLYDDFVQVDEATGLPKYHWQILEFCSRGELFDLIDSMKGKSGIGEDSARRFLLQLISGLRFIHSRGIAHLDISPENVLIDELNNAKIIDFGMARALPQNGLFPASDGHRPGKLAYMAPEIFSGSAFDGRLADAYSLGVVLFTMLVGFPPYGQPSVADKRFEMIYGGNLASLMNLWGLSDKVSSQAIHLMQSLLSPASQRPSLDDILSHPWLNPQAATSAALAQSRQVVESIAPNASTVYFPQVTPQYYFNVSPHSVSEESDHLSHDDEFHREIQLAAQRAAQQSTRTPSYVMV